MFDPQQYQLLDFGNGKKWERFAGAEVVRSCPAADGVRPAGKFQYRNNREIAVFDKTDKQWQNVSALSKNWLLSHRELRFNLKPTPFGHLGVFVEQVVNWDWIARLPADMQGKKALNLFAYTGGTTLALAKRGAQVVHVDSAKNVVGWARENASSSGLADAPIRWIVDDAIKFLEREVRRQSKYEILIADPPAIGHAGKKLTWKFERDIDKLARLLAELASDSHCAVLLSCHSQGYHATDLRNLVATHFSKALADRSEIGAMNIACQHGRSLNCGHFCRLHTFS